MRSVQLLTVMIGLVILGAGDLPAPARPARQQYDGAIAKAQADYDRQTRSAQEQYLADLNTVLKTVMKAGELDDAIKIKAEIDAVKSDVSTRKILGTWEVRFPDGGDKFRLYHLGGTSADFRASDGAQVGSGKLQSVSPNEAACRFDNIQEADRFALVNERLYVECYWGPARIGGVPKNIGVGTPAK